MVNHHGFTSLLFSFILLSFHSEAKILLQLERGHSLSVEDAGSTFLTSPDNTFTCGFYGLGTNAYWFAIWFTNSRDKTVVWVANRARPVNSQGSKVKLEKNGALTLTDVDGAIVWESNTTSTRVNTAELLDTGNLVLKNPQGDVLWQSFGFPTHTLLPSQVFTKNNRLISVLREGGFDPGYFSLYFDGDNVLKLIYDGPEVSGLYWPNPDLDPYGNQRTSQNSTRIAFLDTSGRFFSSDRQVQILYLNASDAGDEMIKRRMTLDVDGNLRIYSLQDSTGLWKVTWQALPRPCKVHGICGRNGVCYYAPEPKCSCPPGYVVVNPNDWSRGCKALFNITSLVTQPVKFLEISQMDYWGFDLNFTKPFSLEDCKNLCLKDHNCMAFAYRRNGEASCYTKNTLYNGYRSPDFPGSIFLKLPRDFPVPESGHPMILTRSNFVCSNSSKQLPLKYEVSSKKVRWVYLYSFCSAVGVIEILVFALGWWALFSKHGIPASLENGYCMLSSQFRMFTYAELKKATKNFKVELGRGGSGAVYKGVLADDRAVAVKKLGDEFHGEEQFWAEMTTIGKINHMNLVRMWGFCAEGKHRLLVYEYVENSSLDKHIYTSNSLGWKERFEVALGTAKGLAYLHHECLEWVIHCDVKPENILLTGELEPKIADFGLAKLSQRGEPGSYFTKIRGTKGYMAPEWALNQPITSKVDVYGYGVVILEMVKGSRLSSWAAEESELHEEAVDLKQFLWAMKSKVELRDESWVEDIVDKRLEGNFSRRQARTLIKVGVACVEEDRNMRPTMASVVQTLLECEDETTVIQTSDPLHI
ncbi:PREDICTED: putative receptor protein kinase ZmPK1 isoform X1 [Ipomoea nil]|uniref:putative receptor protein kinase ZmPK1 isoform X1 n=1 Tax=Ipomoea nil TaxID=35883 RepID=UPI0009016E54|nr:PREDICTED: putative receptor protein kinase ZmPK1 isoform X1 [Ipomoea nil]